MAEDETAEGSRSRRRMDLNLYLGLPPLPRPPGRLGVAADCPEPLLNWANPAPEAPRMEEQGGLLASEEAPPLPAVYSPSNALSTPELSLLDPMVFAWLDGHSTDSEDALEAAETAVALDALSDDANGSAPQPPPPLLPLAGLEEVDVEPSVERISRSNRVSPAGRTEMVSMTILSSSIGGAIEDMTPELRLQRLIQVSEQHRIVSEPNRNQRPTSPEAERLTEAIQRSHSILEASRRQKLDGDGIMGGTGALKKDGICGCNSSFECNICLEAAKEPVVTPCGHLFCWSCLYQWLHGHSVHSECPVCKGEVLEVNVTPIYGRGGGEVDPSSNVPPRPGANRSESFRQQLQQMPDPRGIASMVQRLIENQDIVRAQAAPSVGGVEVTVLPAARSRGRVRRQQRQDSFNSPAPILRRVIVATESGNQVPLPSSDSNNAAPAVPAVPQQSSSIEQASTSSTVAVIVGQAAQSRRSRPSESAVTRRTRRRQ